MQMMLQRLGLADLAGDLAIALRLAGLALQRLQLRGELADQIAEALEIGFRGLEAKLGLVPAAMQAGNAGGIFQHAAALLRRGIDDLADAALAHQRRRARAGRRVLEQQADVARPRILAVDPVGRADLALDPPRHFEVVGVVELGRRRARAIVDEQRHLGAVAGRPVLRAGEDHVLHGRAAHALIGGLAHGPAQRLEQVRLAAAVRPDHAGQPRLDQDLGRLDEGFEAEKAKTGDLQLRIALGPGRSDARFNASAGAARSSRRLRAKQSLELFEGDGALRLAAIGKKGRRADHAKFPPPLLHLREPVDNGLIREAFVKRLARHAARFGHRIDGVRAHFLAHPFGLAEQEGVEQGEIFILRRAAIDDGGGRPRCDRWGTPAR